MVDGRLFDLGRGREVVRRKGEDEKIECVGKGRKGVMIYD